MRAILQQMRKEVVQKYEENVQQDGAAQEVETMRAAEMEIEAFKEAIGRDMMQAYTRVRSQQAAEAMKACGCGDQLPVHEWTQWQHGTLHGNVQVRDPYGYCRHCQQKQRPLHGLLGMTRQRWSLAVERAAIDFGIDHGFGKSEEKMKEHYPGTGMGKSQIRSTVLGHGGQAFAYLDDKLRQATEAGLDQPWRRTGAVALEVQYDASFIRTGLLKPAEGADAKTAVTDVRGQPKRQRITEWRQANLGVVAEPDKVAALYTARFGESDAAFDDLFGLACLAGWSVVTDTTAIADGARHIRPNLEERFRLLRPDTVQVGPAQSQFRFILDRPHAKQHLMAAGAILASTGRQTAQAWMEAAIDKIDDGRVKDVIAQLKRAAQRHDNKELKDEADYFARNQDAVDYSRFKAEGHSIASGRVESGHGHVIQDRMKLPGAWWHPDNVDPMLALRVLRANGWWDDYWKEQAQRYEKTAAQLRAQHLPQVR